MAVNSRAYRDKDWLYQKYVKEQLSTPKIARLCGVNFVTIWEWLKRHGIETRRSGPLDGEFVGIKNPWSGGKHTEETIRHMKESRRGSRNGMFGKKHRPETIALLRQRSTGVKKSEETLKKLSASLSGENHWNWRGGAKRQRYAPGFSLELKEEIRKRDGYICAVCGAPQGKHKHPVHHVDYDKTNHSKNNLVTLCDPCHIRTNYHREAWEMFFGELLGKERQDTIRMESEALPGIRENPECVSVH